MAEGGSDLCLTSVNHYLKARSLWATCPPATRRSSSRPEEPHGHPRRPGGGPGGGPAGSKLVAGCQAALAWLGLSPSERVPVDYGHAPAALGRAEVDAVPDYVDLVPRTRRQAGVEVRAVPFDLPLYSSGLVAADRLPADLVEQVGDAVAAVAAVAAALEPARHGPEAGMDALLRRYPDLDPSAVLEGWELAIPNIFTEAPVGSMDAATRASTLEFASGAQEHPRPAGRDRLPARAEPSTFYRPHHERWHVKGPPRHEATR